jgi:hypothetical protein
MSLRIAIDGIDVTNDIIKGFESYTYAPGEFFPSEGDTWLDLLKVITENETLKNNFFTAGVHRLQITDDSGAAGSAKIWLKSKYSTRNR